MADQQYIVTGIVLNRRTRRGVGGLRIEVWDRDLVLDDLVGSTTTRPNGTFRLAFDSSYFSEIFADREPDLYFRVYRGETEITNTQDSVIWNVKSPVTEVVIPVDIEAPEPGEELPPVLPDVPYVVAVDADWDPTEELKIKKTDNPRPNGTLGDIGLAVSVEGPDEFPETVLVIPYESAATRGVETVSMRIFRWDEPTETLQPVWNSAVNEQFGFFWTKIQMPGIYVPIGLPSDTVLREVIWVMAQERRFASATSEKHLTSITEDALKLFTDVEPQDLQQLRQLLTRVEVQTRREDIPLTEFTVDTGGHIRTFPLPGDATLEAFIERLAGLTPGPNGLPEEELFFPPDLPRNTRPPWDIAIEQLPWRGIDIREIKIGRIWEVIDITRYFPWLFSKNWWMYQHDQRHTGLASGGSDIRSSSVHRLREHKVVSLDGPVLTKPSIVDGKIYVGTSRYGGGGGGTLYKIDLASGAIESSFSTSGTAFYSINGIGGSPAVTGGKVYFTTVYGKVYCLDATTLTQLWVTDLKNANAAQNQPINNLQGDGWSGPVVANGKVYVGSGEGESSTPFGFVWCLNGSNGHVSWVYCMNKFVYPDSPGNENEPNVIPRSAAISDPLPPWATAAGFSLHDDPPHKGAAVWSSCAYDSVTNRIFVCSGNSRPDNPLPDERYASGMIALDAATGQFQGFFQPASSDSYYPGDFDVDVPGAPTVFTRGGQRVVGFGSKNGSYFLLDASTMNVLARRQLIARVGGSGLPGDVGTPIESPTGAVPHGGTGENKWGVMGTAALHSGTGRIFIGLGGYSGVAAWSKTPFIRAVDWSTLADRWPTYTPADNIVRYSLASPPVYTSGEAALSSPAVVNDVVFVSTHKMALYALDVATGLCLWAAPALPSGGWPYYSLGPAIYGNYVVNGAADNIYIYKLSTYIIPWEPPVEYIPIDPWPWPWPRPWPIPFPGPFPPGPGPDPSPIIDEI